MLDYNVYEDIAGRSGGDIYIGVVGPVRTGKSTLIKKFMTELVIPNVGDGNKGGAGTHRKRNRKYPLCRLRWLYHPRG